MASPAEIIESLTANLPQIDGPILLGIAISSALAGLMQQQAVVFFSRFRNEHRHRYNRMIVLCLAIMSLLSWANSVAIGWFLFITIPQDPLLVLKSVPRNWDIVLVAPNISTSLSHVFFMLRTWNFSGRSTWMATLLSILFVLHLGIGVAAWVVEATPQGAIRGDLFVPQRTRFVGAAALCTGAVVDIFLSTLLAMYLRRSRRGFDEGTDSILTRFFRLSIVTGGLTSALATATALVDISVSMRPRFETVQTPLALTIPQITGLCVCGTLNFNAPAPTVRSQSSGTYSGPGSYRMKDPLSPSVSWIGRTDAESKETTSMTLIPSRSGAADIGAMPPARGPPPIRHSPALSPPSWQIAYPDPIAAQRANTTYEPRRSHPFGRQSSL